MAKCIQLLVCCGNGMLLFASETKQILVFDLYTEHYNGNLNILIKCKTQMKIIQTRSTHHYELAWQVVSTSNKPQKNLIIKLPYAKVAHSVLEFRTEKKIRTKGINCNEILYCFLCPQISIRSEKRNANINR